MALVFAATIADAGLTPPRPGDGRTDRRRGDRSVIFLPAMAALYERQGWRTAELVAPSRRWLSCRSWWRRSATIQRTWELPRTCSPGGPQLRAIDTTGAASRAYVLGRGGTHQDVPGLGRCSRSVRTTNGLIGTHFVPSPIITACLRPPQPGRWRWSGSSISPERRSGVLADRIDPRPLLSVITSSAASACWRCPGCSRTPCAEQRRSSLSTAWIGRRRCRPRRRCAEKRSECPERSCRLGVRRDEFGAAVASGAAGDRPLYTTCS